jgi:hypothetical protein
MNGGWKIAGQRHLNGLECGRQLVADIGDHLPGLLMRKPSSARALQEMASNDAVDTIVRAFAD